MKLNWWLVTLCSGMFASNTTQPGLLWNTSTHWLGTGMCGVTNWLLSLTGYGNNALSPQRRELPGHTAGSLQAYRCCSLAVLAATLSLVLVHWLCFGSYSISRSCCSGISQISVHIDVTNIANASIHPIFRARDSKMLLGQGRRCWQRRFSVARFLGWKCYF